MTKLFSPFELEEFPEADKISESVKLEYIREMTALAKNDKQAVFLYVAFALAVIAFSIINLDAAIDKTGEVLEILFYVGMVTLIFSGLFFFSYWRKIHVYQARIISCIPSLNIEKAKGLWVHLWESNKFIYIWGLRLLILGSILIFGISIFAKMWY